MHTRAIRIHNQPTLEHRFGLLHRIPAQPEDRVPGTIPPELQEQGDEYGSQDLFVPADVSVDENQHNHGHLADWQHQQRGQWNHESVPGNAQVAIQANNANFNHHHAHTLENAENSSFQ